MAGLFSFQDGTARCPAGLAVVAPCPTSPGMPQDLVHGLTPALPPCEPATGTLAPPDRVAAVMARLAAADPDPKAGLGRGDPYQLLVTVLMSAQSTGPTVGRVARELFAVAPTPEAVLALGRERVAEIIKPVGLALNKSRHIVALSRMLIDEFGGAVPRSSVELQRFPGIGRKTADVTANFAFDEPVIGVDTHVFRVSNRIPLAPGRTPDAVADGLLAAVPDRYKDGAHVWLFRHGRDTCTARRPACGRCAVADLCEWPGKEVSS
ncbi:endonuclease III domain-containing protein [Lichenibacterium dinghuense]|uniref:endonuclease III domain-containing protein n=1 Tax=Lichenibacterium dinghuense TaxID=2895977 RepID=UPI001F2B5722|nr:endonuclease III [Lichenibacterium sp. 6Y81]